MRVPNVRSWAVAVSRRLAEVVDVAALPELVIDGKVTPPQVRVKPVVGGNPEEIMTLERFREEYPLLRSTMIFARELYEATNVSGGTGEGTGLGTGPTFEELYDLAEAFVARRVRAVHGSERRDIGIYHWSRQALNILETAIRQAPVGTSSVPILSAPEYLDSALLRRFQWSGLVAEGKKCHTSRIPCHNELEKNFANFLDGAKDVLRYFKNERWGFSITYYENNRPRQYYPDFLVAVKGADGAETMWVAETKGEKRHSTDLKKEAAELWCAKISGTAYGVWRYLYVPQRPYEVAVAAGGKDFAGLMERLGGVQGELAGALQAAERISDFRTGKA